MSDYAPLRTTMVDTQVRPSDVTKFPIIDAMLTVPREEFVPDALRPVAYADQDVPLEGGRTVLAPRTFAKMIDALAVGPDAVVLDLGCGLGYSTAVLAHMARAVVAVEPDQALADEAQQILSRLGVDNAAVTCADLTKGAPQEHPYDAILLNGAIEIWPDALTEQLRDGGLVVAIWGSGALGTARLGRKIGGQIVWRDLFSAHAPLFGDCAAPRDFAL